MKTSLIKHFLLLILVNVFAQFLYGQKTELSFNAYTGLFSFHGNGSSQTSGIILNSYSAPFNATSNVYGRNSAFSYSLELQALQIIRKSNFFGVGISFEKLVSEVDIESIYFNAFIPNTTPAIGKTKLTNTFITINPFVGHRFILGKVLFDLSAGVDAAFCLSSHEKGSAISIYSSSTTAYATVENNRDKPLIDFRPRLQLKVQYKKVGLIASYSVGLTNFQDKLYGTKAYTGFLRLGIGYKIN